MSGKVVIYERLWNCPACGTKDISALRKKKCPNCGYSKTSQDEERRTRIQVTDTEGLALAMGGENWTCSNCGSVNLKKHKKCASCSNPKDKTDSVNKVRKLDSLPPEVYIAEDEDQQWYKKPTEEQEPMRTRPVKVLSTYYKPIATFVEEVSHLDWTMIRNGAIALFVTVVFVLIGYGIFHTKEVDGTVASFSWSRDVVIQRYETVHHTDESFTPVGAYNITSRQVSRQVPVYRNETTTYDCSYTTESCVDLGNGSESCTTTNHSQTCSQTNSVLDRYDTVWDTYYSYDRDEWKYERTAHADANDRSPYWPEYELYLNGQQIIGAERVSETPESYAVYFEAIEKEETKVYSLTTSEAEWQQYVKGETYPLKINSFNAMMNNPLQDKISIALTAQPK